MGDQTVKNIASPVRTYRVLPETEQPKLVAEQPLALPDKPSIAVLPFQNMSGDPEQEYFADGVVEEITTALSRVGWLFVIARNSSFAYKGTSPDIRKVGRELGVRYILEGSIRRAGDRVRIAAQLIETTSGGHIWAERFEDRDTDLFALQDRITEHVVGALEQGGRVEERRGAARAVRFPSPLIKPDVRISRIRLSDWLHRKAHDKAFNRPRVSGRQRLRLATELRPTDPGTSGVCRLIANHHALSILGSAPEVRVLPSTGVTRPQQYFDPVRLPPTPTPETPLRPLPSCQTGIPRLPEPPSQRAVPTTPADRMSASVDCFPIHAAFPVLQAGRHPHLYFRGLLRLHSRYGPLACSTAQGGLCHEASAQLVTRPSRSSATGAIDNSPGGTSLHR
jgi:TolB-like protein